MGPTELNKPLSLEAGTDNGQKKEYNRKRLREIMSILAKHDIIHGLTPEKLRLIIEDLGPTFVKIGQVLSMRQDILPSEYCKELTKLQTDVAPLNFSEIKGVMRSEYGLPLRDIFASIDETPLGSASIAQVHKAVLISGEEVVVKVQRPGIRETMAQDIALLDRASTLLKIASGTGNAVDFKMIFDEIWFTAQQEMDFLMEAHNADNFAELNKGILYVTSPRIYHKYTTSKVLVMDYLPGVDIDKTDALKSGGYDLEEIAMKLSENYIKQVIDDGFFHADPHPGNIRIDGGKIAWIDLGMMGTLSTRDKDLFRQAIEAVGTRNIEDLKTVVLNLGVVHAKVNHTKMYNDVEQILDKYGSVDLGSLNVGTFMEDMLRLANDHSISMPKGVTMLSRGIITLEGTLETVSPELNIIDIMLAHIQHERLEKLDPKEVVLKAGQDFYSAGRSVIKLPAYALDLLKATLKGQTKINLEITGSEDPLEALDQMVNKIVNCIITAALLIGSSFISATNMEPKLLGIPALGTIGYIVALILSANLIYGIFHKKKKN